MHSYRGAVSAAFPRDTGATRRSRSTQKVRHRMMSRPDRCTHIQVALRPTSPQHPAGTPTGPLDLETALPTMRRSIQPLGQS